MPHAPYRPSNARAAHLSPFERDTAATVSVSPFVEYCVNIVLRLFALREA
jgi:hypothetical protein